MLCPEQSQNKNCDLLWGPQFFLHGAGCVPLQVLQSTCIFIVLHSYVRVVLELFDLPPTSWKP